MTAEIERLREERLAFAEECDTLRARLAGSVELLEIATCPWADCDGEQYPSTLDGEWERCQWHEDRDALIAKLKKERE